MQKYLHKIVCHYLLARGLFLCSLLHIQASDAQIINFRTYGIEDGLIQSDVLSIIQDRKGEMWFSTTSGISRFDGFRYREYTTKDGLAENYIIASVIDDSGNIWFGHQEGTISIYDERSDSIYQLINDEFQNEDIISKLYKDSRGDIWISTIRNGVFNYHEGHFYHLTELNGLPSNIVFDFLEDNFGNIWIASFGGITRYNSTASIQDTSSFITINEENSTLISNKIRSLYRDTNGSMWVGTFNKGFCKIESVLEKITNPKDIRITLIDIENMPINITSIIEDRMQNIWIGTNTDGVIMLSKSEKGSYKTRSFSKSNGLSTNSIFTTYKDRENNLWFGTRGGGASMYSGMLFETYTTEEGLIEDYTFAIHEDNNKNIWIGSFNNGLTKLKYDKKNQQLGHAFNVVSEDASSNKIRTIVEDKKGNIWSGSWGGGINIYDAISGRFIERMTEKEGLLSNYINCFAKSKKGDILIGSNKGLQIYSRDEFKNVRGEDTSMEIHVRCIKRMEEDPVESFLIGTDAHGVLILKNGVIQPFVESQMLKNMTVYSITMDKSSAVWLGTDHGAFCIKNKQVIQYDIKKGLSSLDVYLITTDAKNNIWMGTPKGLDKYDQVEAKFSHYDKKDGFIGVETNANAVCRASNNTLWFGTINGATKCNLEYDIINKTLPITTLSDIIVKNKGRMSPTFNNPELSHKNNEITFKWKGVSLTIPEKVTYKYRLEGHENNWRPVSSRNEFTYTNLDPGEYTFMVKAANNDGIWNINPTKFHFYIRPPWYKTTYAIIAYIILVPLIIYSVIKYRLRQIEKEKKILEYKVHERTAELETEKQKVEKQKEVILEKNKDITDSIEYAKKIQQAILPSQNLIHRYLPETFILFKPKDIVSGDFYWFKQKGNKSIIAAVDCTGHGVPGGFMSMIGNTLLNRVVSEMRNITASEILFRLREGVINSLQQSGEETKDGMDISLCVFDMNTNELQFSGAFNPLYIIREGELIETKGDKQPIGSHYTRSQEPFTNHIIQLEENDSIYLFSDGYADQFGGPKEKKFRYKNFKELLISIHKKPAEEQRRILDDTIDNWRGDIFQLDDILVIGIKYTTASTT